MKHRYVANPPARPGLLSLGEQLDKEMLAKMGEQLWQGSLESASTGTSTAASTSPRAGFDAMCRLIDNAKAARAASPFGGERHLYIEMADLDARSPLYKLQVPPEARVVFGPRLALLDPAVERCLHQLDWPVLGLFAHPDRRVALMQEFWPDKYWPWPTPALTR